MFIRVDIMVRKNLQRIDTNGFQLYLTEGGIVFVTDDVRMSILEELAEADKTLAELSRILNVPLSTLFSNLNKMVSQSLIASCPCSDDKRKIMYSLVSMKLIESIDPDSNVKESPFDLLNKAVSDPGWFYRSIMMFINFSSFKIGLNIGPLMERAGRILANVMKDDLRSDKVEELIPKLKAYFVKANLPDITVFTFVPLTIILQLDFGTTSKPDNLYSMTRGFIVQALSNHTGLCYKTLNAEIFGSDNSKFKFILEPETMVGERRSKIIGRAEAIVVKDNGPMEYFEIYATERGTVYNSNATQLSILDKLKTSSYTLSELSRDLDISQSTVFSNLNKMVDDGLIAVSDNQADNRKVLYKLTCTKILSQKAIVKDAEQRSYAAIERAAKNPDSFFRCLFDFLLYESDVIGLELSDIAYLVGSEFAKKIKEANFGCKIEEIMDKICKNSDMIGAESVSVMTYIPMTIMISCYSDNEESVSKIVSGFYQGFFSKLILLMTDIPYVVKSSEEIREDKIVHKYVFEASSIRAIN